MSFSIVLADNNILVSEGICSLFQSNPEYNIVAKFNTGVGVIEYLSTNHVDLILMDINLLDMSGYDLFSKIRKINSSIKIVFLTESNNSNDIVNAYDLNANGYVLKNVSFKKLLTIIDEVKNGCIYYDPAILPMLNKELLNRDTKNDLLSRLTNREKQILINVANGLSNKEIASECNISERTVKNHLSNIFQKIEVADRTQAAVFAIKTSLIKL